MKKLLFFIGILIALFIINGLVQSIVSLSQKNSVVEKARQELKTQEEQNKKLKQQLSQVKDPVFVEKEARNKLFLVKPGEQVVIIPSPTVTPTMTNLSENKVHKPHWQEWYDYFFSGQ
jgi:cell division protein FtsB